MTDPQLEILNKAYLVGEYDLKRYRELREQHIDAVTGGDDDYDDAPTQSIDLGITSVLKQTTILRPVEESEPTLQITEARPPNISRNAKLSTDLSADKQHRGPSFLQFLWVSIAVLLFIYMYTATID